MPSSRLTLLSEINIKVSKNRSTVIFWGTRCFKLSFVPIVRSDVARVFLDNKSDGNALSSGPGVKIEVENCWIIDLTYI